MESRFSKGLISNKKNTTGKSKSFLRSLLFSVCIFFIVSCSGIPKAYDNGSFIAALGKDQLVYFSFPVKYHSTLLKYLSETLKKKNVDIDSFIPRADRIYCSISPSVNNSDEKQDSISDLQYVVSGKFSKFFVNLGLKKAGWQKISGVNGKFFWNDLGFSVYVPAKTVILGSAGSKATADNFIGSFETPDFSLFSEMFLASLQSECLSVYLPGQESISNLFGLTNVMLPVKGLELYCYPNGDNNYSSEIRLMSINNMTSKALVSVLQRAINSVPGVTDSTEIVRINSDVYIKGLNISVDDLLSFFGFY